LAGEPADAARRGLGGVIGPRERGLPARDGLSPRLLDDLGEALFGGQNLTPCDQSRIIGAHATQVA
jgi:hypothetical protein